MNNNDDRDKKKRNPLANLALVTQIAISIMTPILLGLYIGKYLDQKFNKDGLFTVILLLLGAGSGLLNLFKMSMPKDKEK